jgi:hypothetical protein
MSAAQRLPFGVEPERTNPREEDQQTALTFRQPTIQETDLGEGITGCSAVSREVSGQEKARTINVVGPPPAKVNVKQKQVHGRQVGDEQKNCDLESHRRVSSCICCELPRETEPGGIRNSDLRSGPRGRLTAFSRTTIPLKNLPGKRSSFVAGSRRSHSRRSRPSQKSLIRTAERARVRRFERVRTVLVLSTADGRLRAGYAIIPTRESRVGLTFAHRAANSRGVRSSRPLWRRTAL